MADDKDFEVWDDEFLKKAIQLTEAAVCSSSSSNPTQPPPKLFPPPPPPHNAPHISYSPPRELSQRVKEDTHRNFPVKGFDCPVSLNGINRGLNSAPPFPHSSRLHDEDKCSKQQEINRLKVSPPRELSQRIKEDNHRNFPVKGFDCPVSLNGVNRGLNSAPPFPHSSLLHDDDKCSKQQEINRLKEELGRVSKVLTNLEQECLELRKDREKNEKHPRSVLPVNGSKDPEAFCTKKSNLKNKDPSEDSSHSTIIHPGTKGVIPCKAVGVHTDDHELMIKKSLSVTNHSRKLTDIWEPGNDQQPRNNLVSKLFVACGADLQVLFGCLGLNIPSKKTTTKIESFNHDLLDMAPDHCIQSVEAAKVSHLYLTLTKISYDVGRLDDLLEALVTLCHVQNKMIVHRSLCVLHVVLKHILSVENKGCSRDNVIVNEKHSEVRHLFPCHPVLSSLINAKKVGDSSSLKWFSYYQTMHQIITAHSEEIIRVEAVSIMNILLLRTDAYKERQMYGEVPVFETISQLLRKEAGVSVQKQTVDLLYLLLNCPSLMLMFCSSCKEEGTSSDIPTTSTETAPAFKGPGAILEGLADCLASRANGAPKTLVLKLQRNAIILVAFLASSGRRGFEILYGSLFLILQILASEVDVEEAASSSSSDDFRERTLVIREALILLNRVASNPQYSTPVLRLVTNRRGDRACLTIDIATRLSRKPPNCFFSSVDSITRQMRESEIPDLARIFKKRVFSFLGDALPLEK